MSAIYFHSEHGDAKVRGSERAYANLLAYDLAMMSMRIIPRRLGEEPDSSVLATIKPPIEPRWVATTLSFDDGNHAFVLSDGSEHRISSTLLNTAIALGSRPIQLLARLHAQCEIHAWVDGKDRAWLADVIEEGRRSGVLRARAGWEDVVELLRSRDDGEVVTSYSVCEQFPNPHVIGWTPPAAADETETPVDSVAEVASDADAKDDEEAEKEGPEAFYDLDPSEQWRLGMEWLKVQSGCLQITPENLSDPEFFGSGMNGFRLMETLADEGHKRHQEKLEAIRARGELPSVYDL